MFDSLTGRNKPGGFLSATRRIYCTQLEKLEERDVPAVISGFVYHDANGNGIRDANEVGIANSTIQLFDQNTNRLIATTVTDASGRYEFTRNGGVTPAPSSRTYELDFEQVRTNVTRSGTLPMFDASLGTLTSVQIIAEGVLNSHVVVENLESTSSEMSAHLKGAIRYNVNGRTIMATTTRELSASVGAFDGTPDLMGTSAHDFGITQMAGSFQTVTLTNPSDLAAFIGNGTVNVSQSANMESCACGTGNLLAMIRSMTQGKVKLVYNYQPSNDLGPGTYRIVQSTQPAGYLDGYETRGNVSKLPGTNRTDFIVVNVVNRGDVVSNNNFGEVRPSIISGHVYHDVNRSGSLDAGDVRLPGVLITLTGVDIFGQQVTRTTTTNTNGFYVFGNLVAGDYTIRETQPVGYQQGTNTPGSAGGTVNGDSISLRLEQAVNSINNNFGEILATTPPNPPSTIITGGKGNFFYTVGFGNSWNW